MGRILQCTKQITTKYDITKIIVIYKSRVVSKTYVKMCITIKSNNLWGYREEGHMSKEKMPIDYV